VSGHVTEIKTAQGSVLQAGSAILSIQSGGDGLELELYIPAEHGKKVKPGMEVQIEPSTVKKEESGTMLGRVRSISDFPATPQGMLSVLQNEQLVHQFTVNGPPYAARVVLDPSPTHAGGYRWSSGDGPDIAITSGTLVTAEVTVREQHPISLVIPLMPA